MEDFYTKEIASAKTNLDSELAAAPYAPSVEGSAQPTATETAPKDYYSEEILSASQTTPDMASAWDEPTSKEQQIREIANPLEGIAASLEKGYAESASGTNTKLLAIAKFLQPVYDTTTIQQNLRQNAQYWNETAHKAEEKGGDNVLLNMVGGLPIGIAEFGATKNPVSIIAAAGIMSALKDYGDAVAENPDAKITFNTLEAGAVGAALTGATLGAIHATGVGVENLAKLVQKHGVQTVSKLFAAINGGDEKMGQKALDLLSDPAYNKKEILPATGELKKAQSEAVGEFKASAQKEEAEKVDTFKMESASRDRDFDHSLDIRRRQMEGDSKIVEGKAQDAIDDLVETRDRSIARMRELSDENIRVKETQNEDLQGKLTETRKDAIAQEAEALSQKTSAAKMAVQEEIHSAFSNMLEKIQTLRDTTGAAIKDTWGRIVAEHPNAGVTPDKLWERIKNADGGENLFKFSMKDGSISVTTPSALLEPAAQRMTVELNNALINREGDNVSANIMRIAHDFFDNAARMPADKGAIVPGIGRVYSNLAEAFHVKNYVDSFIGGARAYAEDILALNQKYGRYKDNLAEVYGRYFKKEGNGVAPDIEKVFRKFQYNDRGFIDSLAKSEEVLGLREEDKVFNKVQSIYKRYAKVKDIEEETTVRLNKEFKQSVREENAQFNKSIDALKKSKIRAVDAKRLSMNEKIKYAKGEKDVLSAQERQKVADAITVMKRQNEVENKAIQAVFDAKMGQFAEAKAKDLAALKNTQAEDLLTLETKHMLRSFRPQDGFAHILQNIGMYGAAGSGVGLLTGAVSAAKAIPIGLGKGIMATLLSPRVIANTARFALRNKAAVKAGVEGARIAGETMRTNAILRRLVASQITKK